jgi:hypothetical protein
MCAVSAVSLVAQVETTGEPARRNRRSLHCATPDFLSKLVALADIMRLSLTKGARAVLSSPAWQEIRVRFGRDDNSLSGRNSVFPGRLWDFLAADLSSRPKPAETSPQNELSSRPERSVAERSAVLPLGSKASMWPARLDNEPCFSLLCSWRRLLWTWQTAP